MNRVGDNYFVIQAINDQALILPAQVKITSIFGDTVIDTVATSSPTVSFCYIPFSTFSFSSGMHPCFHVELWAV